jgi:SSS family solute:Na+ symporter
LACILGVTALVMRDFYIPFIKPDHKHQLSATRIIAIIIGLLPIPFALYVPALLKTIFFARALRVSVTVVVLFMFYAPLLSNKLGATAGLILSVIFTTIWFVLKDPFGIDNMYIALFTPAVVMILCHFFKKVGPEFRSS